MSALGRMRTVRNGWKEDILAVWNDCIEAEVGRWVLSYSPLERLQGVMRRFDRGDWETLFLAALFWSTIAYAVWRWS